MSKENARQKQVQDLIDKYCDGIQKRGGLLDFSEVDKDVIRALEEVKNQHADNPSTDYKMDDELKELGFHEPGTVGIIGCTTIPCCGGKMPDQNLPEVCCVIAHSICRISPRISMRESKAFSDMEAELKEKARLAKNKAARKRYAVRKVK